MTYPLVRPRVHRNPGKQSQHSNDAPMQGCPEQSKALESISPGALALTQSNRAHHLHNIQLGQEVLVSVYSRHLYIPSLGLFISPSLSVFYHLTKVYLHFMLGVFGISMAELVNFTASSLLLKSGVLTHH